MINYNDNPILIDVNSRKRNKIQKIFCVLCNNEKIQLECINPEENRYRCGRCKNDYQLGFRDLVPEEDELMSSHESEEEDSIGLLVSEEDEFKSEDNDNESKSDIAVPNYMKPGPGVTVEYRED